MIYGSLYHAKKINPNIDLQDKGYMRRRPQEDRERKTRKNEESEGDYKGQRWWLHFW